MIILGIETSCDETSVAIVENGNKILSNVISSQVKIHNEYGGVVPELAARSHIENISFVVCRAIEEAKIKIKDINIVAATQGPGLIGALLIGFTFAKSFSYANKIPFFGINHLFGHIYSVFLKDKKPQMPFISLLASGGHTSLYYVSSYKNFELLGQTRDDAVGEAYDKVAKMMGLGYPGGRIIDDIAKTTKKENGIFFSRPYLDKKSFDFSFSGIKTAVLRHIEQDKNYKDNMSQILCGFQEAVVDVLIYKLISAAKKKKCNNISIVGGVAANSRLREVAKKTALKEKMNLYIPTIDLCGDNAAMIAGLAYHNTKNEKPSTIKDDVYSRPKVKNGLKYKQ